MTAHPSGPPRHELPYNVVRVNLPASEVCMHMRVAGEDHWAAQVDSRAAQIYSDLGERFSIPILLDEAGLDRDGVPKEGHRPTCTAFRVCYRDAANHKNSVDVVVADAWDEASYRRFIEPRLSEGQFLVPAQVGLPDAQFDALCDDDHPFHTFAFNADTEPPSELFALVRTQPTVRTTWSQLCEAFAGVDGWNGAEPGS